MLDIMFLILGSLSAIVFSLYTFFNLSEKSRAKKLKPLAFGALGLSFLLALSEITGIAKLYHIKCFNAWVFAVSAVVFVLLEFSGKFIKTEKGTAHLAFFAKTLFVALFFELFVFSFNSYKLMPKDYPHINADLSEAALDGEIIGDKLYIKGSRFETSAIIKLKNIGVPVGTLTVDLESDTNQKTKVNISYSDETNQKLRHNIAAGEIINGNEKSKTFPINASGKVGDILIEIPVSEGERIVVNSVEVNKPMGLKASPVRFLIVVLGALLIYLLLNAELMKKPFYKNEFAAKVLVFAVTAVFVLYAFFLIYGKTGDIMTEFRTTKGNQITQELVDAFKKGQVHLIEEPSKELLDLENPYDKSLRQDMDILWDHVLYNGKHYSYYGIAPVLFLFLPYNLITGYYFSTPWAVLLFGCLGMIFLSLLYYEFIKKFHKDTPLNLFIGSLVLLQMASGVLYCFPTPLFYEIAQTSGFLCITAGAYFMLKSNVIGEGEIRLPSLCLSSTFLALAVLCRPTLAVYSVVALLFIFAGFNKLRGKVGNKAYKDFIKYAAASLIPFAFFGGIQMIYNYLRFDSPLDFGIQYSLTINDFTRAEFHVHLAAIGFFNFLFAFPEFSPDFPFFVSRVQTFSPNGYYFVATNTAIGLIFKAMPVLSLGYWRKAYKNSDSKNKKLYTALLFALGIAAPFIIIASIWESGYGVRYGADFNWQILVCAFAIMFTIYNRLQNKGVKKILTQLFVFSVVVSVILVTTELWSWQVYNKPSDEILRLLFSFGRIFEFWK